MSTIGSFICARNALELDYNLELAANSLLNFCDELILCDSDSTDGTRQLMERMADRDSRIRVVNMPWTNPKGVSHEHWKQWIRFAQSHVKSDWCIYADADEVYDDSPECIAAIREAAKANKCVHVHRINYWKDPFSTIPEGHCCGMWCTRGGPTSYPVVSDWPVHKGEEPVVDNAVREPRIKLHHLGFLRDKNAFYRKARSVLSIWFNRFDERLERGEKENKPVWETECDFDTLLERYDGYQPDAVQRWFADRGHITQKYVPRIQQEPDPVVEVSEIKPTFEPWGILHYGDYGDIIHMLPICKQLGKVNLYFDDRNSICKRILERLHVIQPLLEAQGYVGIAKGHEGEAINWKAGEFRANHSKVQSLARSHWEHYKGQKHMPKITVDLTQPWITGIMPDARARWKIIVNRSSRYHNHYFRWKTLVDHYKDVMMFVGLPDEHKRFCSSFGDIDYIPTANLLEVAQLIAGSDCFMGNQSAALAIAEGMKHRRVVEICHWQPDVVVDTNNAFLSADGALELPPMAGRPELTVGSGLYQINYLVQTSLTPKKGWHGLFKEHQCVGNYQQLRKALMKEKKITQEEAHKLIIDRLYNMDPGYFPQTTSSGVIESFAQAKNNASKPLTY